MCHQELNSLSYNREPNTLTTNLRTFTEFHYVNNKHTMVLFHFFINISQLVNYLTNQLLDYLIIQLIDQSINRLQLSKSFHCHLHTSSMKRPL